MATKKRQHGGPASAPTPPRANQMAVRAITTLRAGLLIVALGTLPSPSRAQNLLVNGSFEEPDVTATFFGFAPFGPSNGTYSIPGWSITAGSIDVVSYRYWQPEDGNNSLDLVGTPPLGLPGAGTIEQNFATEPGRVYSFSGWVTHHFGITIGRADVFVNDVSLPQLFTSGTVTQANMGWAPFERLFQATSSTTTLRLSDVTGIYNYGGTVLDGLSVTPANTAQTLEFLSQVVSQYVTDPAVIQGLTNKLNAIATAVAQGNAHAKAGTVGAFINQVNAQTGKSITPQQAAILIQLVTAL
jgi:hypothetical protein